MTVRRAFDSQSLIQLPRLDAASGLALLAALLTAAKAAKKLPPAIAQAIARLESAHARLHDALSTRLVPADAAGQRAADRDEDAAWGALYSWLAGFARLPDRYPESSVAASILAVLFPDGLRFTQLVYRQEWAEVESRIARMKKDGLEMQIEALGGRSLLDYVHAAHLAYGQALGITAERDATGGGDRTLRDALDEATAALRSYALRVASWGDEGNETVAERLMAPLSTWESAAQKSATPEPQPADPGVSTAAMGEEPKGTESPTG